MVSFLVLSVVVCAWSTTPKLRGRPASVGLAQACPNNNKTSENRDLPNLKPEGPGCGTRAKRGRY